MADLALLGPADVDDAELTTIVTAALDVDAGSVRVLTSRAEPVEYDVPAITTAGRWWVSGEAEVDGQERSWRVFVKQVQCWSRSPFFAFVPDEMKEMAAASVPWRTEGLAYRSDLGNRLPEGLRMPRALAVHDLDELSTAIWLEEVALDPGATWTTERYAEAALALGRLAASEDVAAHRDVGRAGFTIRGAYLEGRLRGQVLPMLRDPDLWQHPLVAGAFDEELRDALLAAADRAEDLVTELEGFRVLTAHGDACPNNLLVPADGEGFVLIDYGFWGPNPLAFDLGQLLVGDVQLGRRPADTLAEVDEAVVPAYTRGLRAEGLDVPLEDVRRAHALQLLLFTGLSSPPLELLGEEPTTELHALVGERAATARYVLGLVDATG